VKTSHPCVIDRLFLSPVRLPLVFPLTHGADAPTIRVEIPGIDTPVTKFGVYDKSKFDWQPSRFGTSVIGGYLGMDFFLKYDIIVLDNQNRKAHFVLQ
jgi:hypothetical protein